LSVRPSVGRSSRASGTVPVCRYQFDFCRRQVPEHEQFQPRPFV